MHFCLMNRGAMQLPKAMCSPQPHSRETLVNFPIESLGLRSNRFLAKRRRRNSEQTVLAGLAFPRLMQWQSILMYALAYLST